MVRRTSSRRVATGIALVALAAFVGLQAQQTQQAQQAKKAYEPEYGQAGKDVVWVPTSPELVEKMLDLAKVTPDDFVIDLGSGDGRTVIAAAKRGARAMGIEYNPEMVELSKAKAGEAGVSDRVTFVKADLFESDFSQATVITMFLLPSINVKLRPKLLEMPPGTRLVSNSFDMAEWTADEIGTVEGDCTNWCRALLWIVPAKVEGSWQMTEGTLTLSQSFQMVTGTLTDGDRSAAISDGRLRGNEFTFTLGGGRYRGVVNGDTIEGTVEGVGAGRTWKARRAQ
ncbi:MAG: class I SAM-dependent methyltransferase [Acidobacteriota bacterium]